MRKHRSAILSIAAIAALSATLLIHSKAVFAQGAQPYKPGPAQPTPELPPELTLHPKFPLQPAAGLYAHNCSIDVVKNDLIFTDPDGKVGVRFPKAQKETRVVVEFNIRVDRTVQFLLRSTARGGEVSPNTALTVPAGLHRVTVRGVIPTVKDGLVQVGCSADAVWSLISAKIRRE